MAEETKEEIKKEINLTISKLNLLFITAFNSGLNVHIDLEEQFDEDGEPVLVFLKTNLESPSNS